MKYLRLWPIPAIALVLLVVWGVGIQNRYAGALQNEAEASRKLYNVKKARLNRMLGALEERVRIGDSLAKLRPTISVSLPVAKKPTNPVAKNIAGSQDSPNRKSAGIGNSATPAPPAPVEIVASRGTLDSINTATVTINDSSYAVPVRVAEVIDQQRKELLSADSTRQAAAAVIEPVKETVAAADTAIVNTGKKPGFLRRVLSGSIDVLCATGGAAVGGAIGATAGVGGAIAGAVAGAGAGVGVCKVAR